MSSFLKQAFSSKIFKETSVLTKGVVIGNIVTVIASIAIARIYSPAEIGYISIFNSLIFILSSIFTLGYDQAIVVAKARRETTILTTFSEILLVIGCLLTLLLCGALYFIDITIPFDIPRSWILFIPFGTFILGAINIYNSWFVDQKEFKVASNNRIILSTLTALTQIIIGLFSLTFWGLLIGYLTGRTASFLNFSKHLYQKYKRVWEYSDIKEIALKFKKYPKYVTPTLLIDRISIEAPFFLISIYFFSTDVGYYAIAYRVLSIPISFIGVALGQVLYKNFSLLIQRSKPMLDVLTKNWIYLALIGAVPTLIISFYGELLFPMVFGASFTQSGSFAIILAPMLFLDFISSPTGKTFLILKLEHYSTYFSVLRIVLIIVSFYIGINSNSIYLALLFYSMTRSLGLIFQNSILYFKLTQYEQNLNLEIR